MRRKRKRKLRRFRNKLAGWIWSRAFNIVCGVTFDGMLSGGNVQMIPARGPTY